MPKKHTERLVDRYDSVLLDLDGVVYLGPVAVQGAPEALATLRTEGVQVGFVTNNAARPPEAVAAHLTEIGVPTGTGDVVTAAQAGARLVLERFGAGAKVLGTGSEGVRQALAEVGLVSVGSADDEPVAVLQGYGAALTWDHLIEAAVAINRGAHWVATNIDPTRPTDRGLVPGNGAAVAAVQLAVTARPEIAGKPYRPLLAQTVDRLGARSPLFVGDRLDTDIAGGVNAGMDTMLVLTGSHGPADLLTAPAGSRPTFLGRDLGALLAPSRPAEIDGARARCGDVVVEADAGSLVLSGSEPASSEDWVDATWAAAQLAWRSADAGQPLDVDALVPRLVAGVA